MKKRIVLTALTDKRTGNYMFLLCFIFYFTLYLGRQNYAAVLAKIIASGVFEKDTAGLIATVFAVSYGSGQLINGFISDRLPPFGLISVGFFVSGIANLGMYFVSVSGLGLGFYLTIWAVNGYAQSFLWPNIIRIVSNIIPEEQRVSAGVGLLATTAVGTVCTFLLSSLIMKVSGWMECFLVPGIILIIASAAWFVLTRPVSRVSVSYRTHPGGEITQDKTRDKIPLLPLLITSGVLAMMIPTGIMAIIKDGVTTWTPTIISETFAVTPENAAIIATVIPFISIFGAAVSKLVMDKWLRDELKSSVFMFAAVGLMLAVIMTFGSGNLVLMLIMLALVIMLMLGINTMYISLVPLRFGKYGKSATVTGILNAVAAVCCGVSNYLVGLISKEFGWSAVYITFFALSIIGAAVTLLIVRRWMNFKRNQ